MQPHLQAALARMTPLFAGSPLPPVSERSTRRLHVLPIVFVGFFLAGCIATKSEQPDITGQPPEPTANRPIEPTETRIDRGSSNRPYTRLVVEFGVHRFTAPRGTFSAKDSPIWKIVSGPLPSASMALHLADSGFRAAIGRESDRRALAETMATLRESTDLRSVVDQIMPDAAQAIEVDIGPTSWPRLAVFYVDGSGALTGLDFQDAKVKFLMNFAMRPESLREVWVQLMPAIEEPPGPPRWVGTPEGGFQQLPELRRRIFSEVALTAPITEGGFLLLGPTEIVYDRPYLARPFFIEKLEGARESEVRESVFVISPILRTVQEGPFDGRGEAARPSPR